MSGKLTENELKVMTFIEQRFWEQGVTPTNESVSASTGISLASISKMWQGETFRGALKERGILVDNRPDKSTLTWQQLMAANAVMNILDRRSTREKCKEIGISVQQLQAWMRQPAFQDHLKKRAGVLLDHAEGAAHRGLAAAIEGGDLKAIQLYYEMKGIYNPRVQVDVNVTVVISRVIEIIGKHIQDPAILMAIADDIEGLQLPSQGGSIPAASHELPRSFLGKQGVPKLSI